MKILLVIGTRPEAIKLLPVYKELKKSDLLQPILVSTGQHKEMLEQMFNYWEVKPQHELNAMTHNQALSSLTSVLFKVLDEVFQKEMPDAVMVQGDTSTAMVGSMVAFYHKCKVMHIEAGLRTYDKYSPFPEEINRQVIGLTSDYNFCPTEQAKITLEKEGKQNLFVTGNTVIDSLFFVLKNVTSSESDYSSKFPFLDPSKKFILITGHRRESFGDGFKNICQSIKKLSQKYPSLEWVYPVHLNPNVKTVVHEWLGEEKSIHLIDPLPYDELIYLMNNCHIVLTDSGGIQEEAPSLNKPILVLRETTERPEGVDNGCARLVGTDQNKIISDFSEIHENQSVYDKMSHTPNPYGDGQASARIRESIENSITKN